MVLTHLFSDHMFATSSLYSHQDPATVCEEILTEVAFGITRGQYGALLSLDLEELFFCPISKYDVAKKGSIFPYHACPSM